MLLELLIDLYTLPIIDQEMRNLRNAVVSVLSWDGTWDMDVLGTGRPGHVYNFYMSGTYLGHFLFKL